MRNAARLGVGLVGLLACWTAVAGAKIADTYTVAPGTADSAAIMSCAATGPGAFGCPNLRSALAAAAGDNGSTVKLSAGTYASVEWAADGRRGGQRTDDHRRRFDSDDDRAESRRGPAGDQTGLAFRRRCRSQR